MGEREEALRKGKRERKDAEGEGERSAGVAIAASTPLETHPHPGARGLNGVLGRTQMRATDRIMKRTSMAHSSPSRISDPPTWGEGMIGFRVPHSPRGDSPSHSKAGTDFTTIG